MSDTKKKIADQGRQLIIELGVEGVSVTKIMSLLNMRRQTFYEYFLDKYDLIEWLCNKEIAVVVEESMKYEKWPDIIRHLFGYFENNKKFYRRLLDDNHSDIHEIEDKISIHLKNLIETIASQISTDAHIAFSPELIEFTDTVFSKAIFGEIKVWISNSSARPYQEEAKFLCYFISDSVNGMLLREHGMQSVSFNEKLQSKNFRQGILKCI